MEAGLVQWKVRPRAHSVTGQGPAESPSETLVSTRHLLSWACADACPRQQRGPPGGHQNFLNVTKATDHYGGWGLGK